MKKYLTCTLAALLTTVMVTAAAPDATVMAMEKAAWQAYKDKNADAFRALASKDYHSIYTDGMRTLDEEMEGMKTMKMDSFEFSDFASVNPDADTIVTMYKVKMEGARGEKKYSGMHNAGSVWRKTDGEWHVVFHTTMPQDTAGTEAQKKE